MARVDREGGFFYMDENDDDDWELEDDEDEDKVDD